jgi:hypothetical protein
MNPTTPQIVNGKAVYQGGDILPAVGSAEYNLAASDPVSLVNFKTANPNLSYTEDEAQYNKAITPESLGTVSPYYIPPANPTPTTGNLSLATNSVQSALRTEANAPLPTVQTETQGLKAKAASYLDKILGNTEKQAGDIEAINKEADLIGKKQRATALSDEMDRLDKDFRDQVKQLKETTGGTTAGSQQAIAAAQDRYENRRANLALTYKVAAGDYNAAQEIVQQKVSALKDSNAQSLQVYQLLVNSINNDLTDSEKLQVESNIRTKESKAKAMESVYGDVLTNLTKNNAPATVFNSVDEEMRKPNATPASIRAAAGKYAQDPLELAQITKIYSDMALSKEELKRKYEKDSTTYVTDPTTGKVSVDAQGRPLTELKYNALTSAQALLNKFINGTGTSAVGGSRIFGLQYLPGTAPKDFTVQFDNLKSLLSLDNVKLLKGQGQVSDAERTLLADASSKLNLSQSEGEFKSALVDVVKALGGSVEGTTIMTGPDGVKYSVPNDKVEIFKQNGYK